MRSVIKRIRKMADGPGRLSIIRLIYSRGYTVYD